MKSNLGMALLAATSVICLQSATAQEAVIRKVLTERLPSHPVIDDVNPTAVPGLYEVRVGTQIIYTDESGDHVISGPLVETKSGTNLTQSRVEKLTAVDFSSLPLKDAVVWTQGTGARKLVVFADPNCGYCKRFETDLQEVKDVTVYTFLIPILGGDSPERARAIWCAEDHGAVWRDWMIRGKAPTKAAQDCDVSALERNLALAQKNRVNGTPSIVFENGIRVPGAMQPEQVEERLLASHSRG